MKLITQETLKMCCTTTPPLLQAATQQAAQRHTWWRLFPELLQTDDMSQVSTGLICLNSHFNASSHKAAMTHRVQEPSVLKVPEDQGEHSDGIDSESTQDQTLVQGGL